MSVGEQVDDLSEREDDRASAEPGKQRVKEEIGIEIGHGLRIDLVE